MTNAASADVIATPVSTGTRGLDELLLGGLTPNRMYLVEGNPGIGENNPCLDVLVERTRCVPAADDLSATVRTSSWSLAERCAGAGSTARRWVDVGDDHAAHRSCRNREVHDGGAIRGDRVTGTNGAIFLFDERASTFISRTDALGMKLGERVKSGHVSLKQIDPGDMSSGEFSHRVRLAVEREGARVILIDSLNGYLNAIPQVEAPLVPTHELLSYLNERGVITRR